MKRKELQAMTKEALMVMARQENIRGRSRMSKGELVEALSGRQAAGSKRVKKKTVKPRKSPGAPSRSDIGGRPVPREGAARETLQQEVEQGRFDLGFRQPPSQVQPAVEDLPSAYGDDRIVLMVRDPQWVYTYWELKKETIGSALARHDLSESAFQQVLRVYTGDEETYHDIDVQGLISNWYVHVDRPEAHVFIDLGLRVDGRFIPLVRSNVVQMARVGMSAIVDEQWMTLDEEADMMYALSGGFRIGRGEGSVELGQMMEKRLQAEISSGAVSSFFGSGGFREKPQRGFWYHLDAELIVYGATEPDAQVTLQGTPIPLREDGTFTVRFALPDGRQEIPVTFVSADQIDQATVTPKVTRKTDRS